MPRSLFALLLAACTSAASGPTPIVWDREVCQHCRMLVSEPRFAAQIQTPDGVALSFDDPGCLMVYVAERRPEIKALWFHHRTESRWLRGDEVGFVPAQTPMGFGLAADDADAPGALTLTQAQAQIAAGTKARAAR